MKIFRTFVSNVKQVTNMINSNKRLKEMCEDFLDEVRVKNENISEVEGVIGERLVNFVDCLNRREVIEFMTVLSIRLLNIDNRDRAEFIISLKSEDNGDFTNLRLNIESNRKKQ